SLRHSRAEGGGPIQRPDQGPDEEARASTNGGIDPNDQSDHPRMGKLLLSLPCQEALSPARRMDRTKALVASREAMEEHGLEALSHETLAWRGVQAGRPRLIDTDSSDCESPSMKAGCGKTARPVVCPAKAGVFSRRQPAGAKVRRPVVWIAGWR